MPKVTSPERIAASLTELWSPRVVAEVDDAYVKVARVHGSLAWHSHDDEDERQRQQDGVGRASEPLRRRRHGEGPRPDAGRSEIGHVNSVARDLLTSCYSRFDVDQPNLHARAVPIG